MEWISVKDRLPEQEDVLLYFSCDKYAVGFIEGEDWYTYTGDDWYTACEALPSCWMPLPEPPKTKE